MNLIHNYLFNILQIMISSQLLEQKNGNKYRANVSFLRAYNCDTHEWTDYVSREKNETLEVFLQSISNMIGKTLVKCLLVMSYTLYEFYYYADNIKIRKQGDSIIIYYDSIRK